MVFRGFYFGFSIGDFRWFSGDSSLVSREEVFLFFFGVGVWAI